MKKPHNESGIVSMLSIIIFSIIITIVATAYLQSVTSQQKNAYNYDLGTRAYYAAESGVQDAVRSLSASPALRTSGKTTCAPADGGGTLGSSTSYDLGYTCQLISVEPASITGSVEPNAKSALFKVEPATGTSGPYKLNIRWSLKTDMLNPRGTATPLFPPLNQWNVGGDAARPVHAMVRISIITHPKNVPFGRDGITQRVVFFNPTTVANSDDPVNLNSSDNVETQQAQLFNNAKCYNPADSVVIPAELGDYACQQTIQLLDGYDLTNQAMYVRISSVYRSTNFSVGLTKADDSAIPLGNTQAIIDVTGRAGNVYRRVQQTVSLGGYQADVPDAAVVAGEGICKLFSIGVTSGSYQQGCNPLGTN